ncbi:hypothetical protein [Demequina gelatinilytica]|uniref:hypothetical protein n=1 Tax=Demequina gelatinilytica TaxID=1638980 RepID=UPI0007850CA5|nr:hypothetical protein [Demequina gelatinilytica]
MEFSYALGLPRQLVLAVTAVSLVEIPVAHLLLARWNPSVAIVVTAASILFIAYVLLDWVVAARRPLRLDGGSLTVNRGLRRPVVVPTAGIVDARTVPSSDNLPRGAARTVYAGEANLLIVLDAATAEALGRDAVAVAADDPRALVAALRAVIERPATGVESPS